MTLLNSPLLHEVLLWRRKRYSSVPPQVWESVIKVELGKLRVDPAEVVSGIGRSGFEPLFVKPEHALALQRLPQYHKDPFDRMLVAQATTESLQLLTADERLLPYSELVVRV